MASAYQNSEILMTAASFPALQLLMQDFTRATGLQVTGSVQYGYSYKMSNGSIFVFKSFDDPTKPQGTGCDWLYIEEALNMDMEIITTLSMSVRRQIIACFNPTRKTGLERYVNSDMSNLLITTYKDNDFLPDEQKDEFKKIEERAKKPTASTMDIYAYKVYCLGEYSEMGGKVFTEVHTLPDDEFDRVPAKVLYGLDFGFVESKDMTALVAVKIHNNCLYASEMIYDNQSMCNDRSLAIRMAQLGITVYEQIVGDYGGLGKTRIRTLTTADDGNWSESGIRDGFTIGNTVKPKVVDSLTTLTNFDRIYVTESSINLRNEMDKYEITNAGTAKGSDHAIDAMRYAAASYSKYIW